MLLSAIKATFSFCLTPISISPLEIESTFFKKSTVVIFFQAPSILCEKT